MSHVLPCHMQLIVMRYHSFYFPVQSVVNISIKLNSENISKDAFIVPLATTCISRYSPSIFHICRPSKLYFIVF